MFYYIIISIHYLKTDRALEAVYPAAILFRIRAADVLLWNFSKRVQNSTVSVQLKIGCNAHRSFIQRRSFSCDDFQRSNRFLRIQGRWKWYPPSAVITRSRTTVVCTIPAPRTRRILRKSAASRGTWRGSPASHPQVLLFGLRNTRFRIAITSENCKN